MVKPQRYFPWKVARQFFTAHFTFVVIALVVTGFSIRYFAYRNFVNTNDIHFALAKFDSYLTSLFLWVLALAGIYLAFTARNYSRPLGLMIQRARLLRRLDANLDEEDVDPEELVEEPGEWVDLERAINRLAKDLRKKTEAHSRESEELSALIGAVTEAILAVDEDENPLFFNSQFAMMFQVNQRGDQAPSLGEIFRVPEVLQAYREVLKSSEMRVIQTTLRSAHHPAPRHFSLSIAPLLSGDGQPIHGALGVFHDVTELKKSEQIRIEFVGNASHELRTPLTSIKGYVDTLRDDLKQKRYDGADQFVEVISRNVDRLIALVNDLLDLSSLESGAELKKQVVSTREVTESVLKALEAKRAGKRQEIISHFKTESVLADPGRLEQVVLNLVHNAVKYTPEGSRIEIVWEGAPGSTVLRVKDNGPGIAVEHHARLFERFYRVDAGRSRDQGGTGLGLSIVKHIILKHNGSISLQSQPGAGAEFVCLFPD